MNYTIKIFDENNAKIKEINSSVILVASSSDGAIGSCGADILDHLLLMIRCKLLIEEMISEINKMTSSKLTSKLIDALANELNISPETSKESVKDLLKRLKGGQQ